MARLNGYYIFVKEEKKTRGVDVTSHAVENGLDITDNVKRKPITLSLEGEIVKATKLTKKKKGKKNRYTEKTVSVAEIESAITKLHQNGKKVKYQGRYKLDNAIITSFDTKHTSKLKSGCFFTMELKEIRIAKKAYKAKAKKKKKQVTKKKKSAKRYHTVKKTDSLYSIAKKYYGSASKMTAIYKANKSKIDKRNKGKKVTKYTIYKGQKLLIP